MSKKIIAEERPKKYYLLGFLLLLIFVFNFIITGSAQAAVKQINLGPLTTDTSKIIMGIAGSQVGIGTDPGATYKLNVNGDTNITGILNVTGSIIGALNLTGSLSSGNVSAGTFGSNTGGGNYIFPGTVTAPTFSGGGAGLTGINADLLDGLNSTTFQQRVSYGTGASNSGYYKINILPETSWMLSFTIRLYQGYRYDDIRVSGYNYGANYWYTPLADLLNSSGTSIDVQFGYDSAYNLWVGVPAGNYTGIEIIDITNGYTQVNQDWSKNFTIVNQTSLTGTVQTTQTVYRPLKYNENAVSATNATYVTGNNATYAVTSGAGNGLKFWDGSDTYKISMGNTDEYHYGPVTDYSIKTAMDSVNSTRGFTWGVNGNYPVAALNVGNGNMQIAGTMTAASFSGGYSGTISAPNVSAGNFGANTGGGNYTFPANVGIGITNPSAKLNINGADDSVIAMITGGIISDGNPHYQSLGFGRTGYVYGRSEIRSNSNIGSVYKTGLSFLTTDGSNALQESMRIDGANGNVGIGTVGPTEKLDVRRADNASDGQNSIRFGSLTYSMGTLGENTATDSVFLSNVYTGAGADISFRLNGNLVANTKMLIQADGNVGIGTTAPNSKLMITDTSKAPNGYVTNANFSIITTDAAATDKGGSILLGGENAQSQTPFGFGLIKGAKETGGTWGGYLSFFTTKNDSGMYEGMRLNSNGNVGIGTTVPYSTLNVSGNGTNINGKGLIIGTVGDVINTVIPLNSEVGRFEIGFPGWRDMEQSQIGAKIAGIRMNYYANNSALVQATELGFFTGNGNTGGTGFHDTSFERMRINSTGYVGIGKTNPATALDVNGTVTALGFSGPLSGSLSAANVSAGNFGASTGGGNYTFPGTVTAPTFTVNGGSQFMASAQAQNMKLKGGISSDVGLTGYNSSDTWVWQLYGAGSTYGFLNSNWGGWDMMKTIGGSLVLNGSQTVIHSGNIGSQSVDYANRAGSAVYLTGPAHTNGGDGWFRSDGANGWYSETYAVGVYATQAGRVDLYNSAGLYVPGSVGIGTAPGAGKLTINPAGFTYAIDAGGGRIGNVVSSLDTDAASVAYVKASTLNTTNEAGTSTASVNLNMNGKDIRAVNKLTVLTIDPLYNIGGTNYSTFASAIAGGVKEELIDKAKIVTKNTDGEYELVIDFDKQTVGSDLWVWRKTVDFSDENVQVLLTPSGRAAQVYYLISNNQLILRSDKPVTISYRLIGRRVDWQQWPTKATDQTEKASIVIK